MYDQKIRVLVYKDSCDVLHAQCLEHDILASANSIKELLFRLIATFIAEKDNLDNIGKAPKGFIDMWEKENVPILHQRNENINTEIKMAC